MEQDDSTGSKKNPRIITAADQTLGRVRGTWGITMVIVNLLPPGVNYCHPVSPVPLGYASKEVTISAGLPFSLPTYIAGLERGLSSDRLVPYRPPGGDDLDMVTWYFWNVALCQALYPGLAALEVSMRNGIHDALSAHFNARAPRGTAPPPWYDRPNLLLQRERDQVVDVKIKIQRSRKAVIPPRVVAGLSYGFWTSLLDTAYGNTIWTAKNPAVLVQQAFPHAPLHLQARSRVHDRFNRIRFLRNRISHLEPVWQGVLLPNGRTVALLDLHAEIVEAIGWVAPTLQATVAALDQFPAIHQNGRTIIRQQFKQHLGIT